MDAPPEHRFQIGEFYLPDALAICGSTGYVSLPVAELRVDVTHHLEHHASLQLLGLGIERHVGIVVAEDAVDSEGKVMFCIAKSTFRGVSTLRFLPLTIPAACDEDWAFSGPERERDHRKDRHRGEWRKEGQEFSHGRNHITPSFLILLGYSVDLRLG